MILQFRAMNKKKAWTWQALYREAGVTRQAVSCYQKRREIQFHRVETLLELVESERRLNKGLGLKKIYVKNSEKIPVGRDVFLQMMMQYGMGIKRKRAYHITTKSLKDRYFPNLIKGLELNDQNQVWQTDITYFSYRKRHLYLTLIIDVYTRFIVGYHFDDNMRTETMIGALQMALAEQNITKRSELIHHSDRGSQYGSDQYLALLEANEIKCSMCQQAWENAYAERLNQTMKREYLDFIKLDLKEPLWNQIHDQIEDYNNERPHWNLPKKMTPQAFKNYLRETTEENRPVMTLYTEVTEPNSTGPTALCREPTGSKHIT